MLSCAFLWTLIASTGAIDDPAMFAVLDATRDYEGFDRISKNGERFHISKCLLSYTPFDSRITWGDCWQQKNMQLLLPEPGTAGTFRLKGTDACLTMDAATHGASFQRCHQSLPGQWFVMPPNYLGPIRPSSDPALCLQAFDFFLSYSGRQPSLRDYRFAKNGLGAWNASEVVGVVDYGCARFAFTRNNPESSFFLQFHVRFVFRIAIGWISGTMFVFLFASICRSGHASLKHLASLAKGMSKITVARLLALCSANSCACKGVERVDASVRALAAKRRIRSFLNVVRIATLPTLVMLAAMIYNCFFHYRARSDIIESSWFWPMPFASAMFLLGRCLPSFITTKTLDVMHVCAAGMWALQYWILISSGEAMGTKREGALGDLHQIAMLRIVFSILLGNAFLTACLQVGVSVFYTAARALQYESSFAGFIKGDLTPHYVVLVTMLLVAALENERLASATATIEADRCNELANTASRKASQAIKAETLIKRMLRSLCDCCFMCDGCYDVIEGSEQLRTLVFRTGPAPGWPLNFLDFLHSDDVERFKLFMHATIEPLADKESLSAEAPPLPIKLCDCHGNSVPCHIYCSCIRDETDKLIYVVGVIESPDVERRDLAPVTRNVEFQLPMTTYCGDGDESSASSSSIAMEHMGFLFDGDMRILDASDVMCKWSRRKLVNTNLEKLFANKETFKQFKEWHIKELEFFELGILPAGEIRLSRPLLWCRRGKREHTFYEVVLQVDFTNHHDREFDVVVSDLKRVKKPRRGTPAFSPNNDLGDDCNTLQKVGQVNSSCSARSSSGSSYHTHGALCGVEVNRNTNDDLDGNPSAWKLGRTAL